MNKYGFEVGGERRKDCGNVAEILNAVVDFVQHDPECDFIIMGRAHDESAISVCHSSFEVLPILFAGFAATAIKEACDGDAAEAAIILKTSLDLFLTQLTPKERTRFAGFLIEELKHLMEGCKHEQN